MDSALQVIENRAERFIMLKSPNGIRNIEISEIMYFETNGRRCDVYLKDGSIKDVKAAFTKYWGNT